MSSHHLDNETCGCNISTGLYYVDESVMQAPQIKFTNRQRKRPEQHCFVFVCVFVLFLVLLVQMTNSMRAYMKWLAGWLAG